MASGSQVQAKPDGSHTLTPHLYVRGGAEALEFYREAFGAEELFRMEGPPGKIGHAEMKIGDSRFMLADEVEAWGNSSPLTLGGAGMSLMLYVDDVDTAFERALEAGAEVARPVQDEFWGDRAGVLKDPFGHQWMLATHVEDVPPEELDRRAKEAMSQM